MDTATRILIIEDNESIMENIAEFMEVRGFILDFARDGISGLHLALTQEYDVIILDLMLPGMDGITLCQKLRQEARNQVPVIMLTARDTLDDKLLGFDSGADDYLVKPFALKELEARVRVLAKRNSMPATHLTVGDLSMDLGTLEVTRQNQPIKLNKSGITLLKLLMEKSPNVVSKSEMEHALWGDMPPGSDALRSHLYTLRKQVDKPFDQPLIHTVHGMGFALRPPTP